VPDIDTSVGDITGSTEDEEKDAGPDQLHVALAGFASAVNCNGFGVQTGELLDGLPVRNTG